MIAELSQMTGLAPLKKVERDYITRAKLKEFLVKRLKEVSKPEEIHVRIDAETVWLGAERFQSRSSHRFGDDRTGRSFL